VARGRRGEDLTRRRFLTIIVVALSALLLGARKIRRRTFANLSGRTFASLAGMTFTQLGDSTNPLP
jgi:hypothetical protein